MEFKFDFKNPFVVKLETVKPAELADINKQLNKIVEQVTKLVETGDILAKAEQILTQAKQNTAALEAAKQVTQ